MVSNCHLGEDGLAAEQGSAKGLPFTCKQSCRKKSSSALLPPSSNVKAVMKNITACARLLNLDLFQLAYVEL